MSGELGGPTCVAGLCRNREHLSCFPFLGKCPVKEYMVGEACSTCGDEETNEGSLPCEDDVRMDLKETGCEGVN